MLYNTYIVMDIITSKNIGCVGVFNDVIILNLLTKVSRQNAAKTTNKQVFR